MKNSLFFLIPILFMLACEAGNQDGNNNSGSEAYVGSAQAPQVPPAIRETELLANNYWVFEFYVVEDAAARQAGRGRWYAFKPDGTFRSGHWQTEGAGGSWGVYQREGKTYLWMDSVQDIEDSEYEIQANITGDEMSWIGTPRYYQQEVMLKAINLMAMPTKKQFGLE